MTTTEHLKANIRYAAEDLLAAESVESASITMGDKRILIGPPARLARMLGYSDTPAIFAATKRAARFWSGADASGHLAQLWTVEPRAEDYPHLTITAHVTMPQQVDNGTPAGWEPVAAPIAAAVPAELTDAQIDALWKTMDGDKNWLRTFGYQQFARAVLDLAGAAAIPAGWREFIENIATPYSEPLNSISGYRDKASRKDAMGELREKAQHLLWSAKVAPVPAAAEGWISVDERLPDDRQAVAFIADTKDWETFAYLHGRPLGGTYDAKNNWFNVPGLSVAASHWMPLPAAPATSDKAEGK